MLPSKKSNLYFKNSILIIVFSFLFGFEMTGLTTNPELCPPPSSNNIETSITTVCASVNSGSDDAEEDSVSGSVDNSSSDLELIFDGVDQVVGMRFNNLNIPQCATINSAFIQFTTKGTNNNVNPCVLQIFGEASDNALTFSNSDFNISSRTKTAASVTWSPADWLNDGDSGAAQQTVDIAPVIQEIVECVGFTSSSSIVIIIEGTGKRIAKSFEGEVLAAPEICIDFNPVIPDDDNDGVCNANDVCPGSEEPGTACDDGNPVTYGDAIDANCDCVGIPFDCPILFANIGDACDDGNAATSNDTITINCECLGSYDCPILQANIGDACDDGNAATSNDTITTNCECLGSYDCPILQANIGDACDDGIPGTYGDTIDINCNCIGTWECPDLMLGFGYPCDDADPNTTSDAIDSTCNCVGFPFIISNIIESSDDAEESPSGGVSVSSSDLELVVDVDSLQIVGLRFVNLNIPQCAVIHRAYIQFTSKGDTELACDLTIYGEASDSAVTFVNNDFDISNRIKTSNSVAWSPAEWESDGDALSEQQTADISSIVQEITDRIGFNSNSPLAFIFEGTGTRRAYSFDGIEASAPSLFIEYNPNAPDDDEDGVCNANDWCPDSPEPLTLCDDGVMETYDDIIDSTCVCVGTPYDCPLLLANIGDSCDDGDPETPNDFIDSSCTCVGGFDCPTIEADFGDTCDDGISGTYDDIIDANCECVGTWECPDIMAGFGDPCDDGDPSTLDDMIDFNCDCIGSPTVYSQVSMSSDDAEEKETGQVSLTSSDLELVDDGVDNNQTVGLRFTNLNIPHKAVIDTAFIQFTADEVVDPNSCDLQIYGEDVGNALTFVEVNSDISSRTKTSAVVNWSPEEWTVDEEAGVLQRTKNLKSIIKEIVDREDYTESSSIAIIIEGSGVRIATAFEGDPEKAAKLYVRYDYPLGAENISIPKKEPLLVYPVPASENLNVSFTCAASAKIPVQIFDLNGRLLFADARFVQKGKNNILIEQLVLENGIYFVQLYFDDAVHTTKFTIMK